MIVRSGYAYQYLPHTSRHRKKGLNRIDAAIKRLQQRGT